MLTADLFGGFGKKPQLNESIETGVTQIAKDAKALGMNEDNIDTVEMDVPFLIRALEYAREDAKDDVDLHNAVERMLKAAQQGGALDMSDYELVFKGKEEVAEDDLGVHPKRAARKGSRPERGHEPVALYKYIKDVEEGSTEASVEDPVVVVYDKKGNIIDKLNASVASKKYSLGDVNSIKQQLANQDFTQIGAYTVGAPMSGQPVSEVKDEADYGAEYQAMVQRVKKLAKEGPRKIIWDPEKRVYKTVPVQQKKQQDVDEGWKEKVAGATIGAAALGGIGSAINASSPTYVDGVRHEMSLKVPDNAQQTVDDKGRKVYVWSVQGHGIKSGTGRTNRYYHPAEQVKEQGVAEEQVDENLRDWFKEKWVRFGPDGKIRGDCARGDDSEGKPKCLPQAKAHALGKKGRASAAAKKRREDPNPERRGPAKNVATKVREEKQVKLTPDTVRRIQNFLNDKFGANLDVDGELGPLTLKSIKKFMPASLEKLAPNPERTTAVQGKEVKPTNEAQLDEKCWSGYEKKGMKTMFGKRYPNCVKKEDIDRQQCPQCGGLMLHESELTEKKDACYYKVKSRYKVWPSAYASGALVQCRKKGASNWGSKSESVNEARSFNDDDWYEIDPETMTIIKQYSPQSFRNPFGDSKVNLPNGNIAVKGLRAKYMDLNDGDRIEEAVSGLELADVLYNGLEQKYPDAVRTFGQEVVANAIMDAAEAEESVHRMADVDLIIDEIYNKLSASQGQGFDDNTLEEFEDPEMEKAKRFAKQHYAGYDEKDAFDKYVQRSLKHSKESDFEQNVEIKQLARDVSKIKQKLGIMETRLYFNVIGTTPAELRKEFGMRKDRNGWFLTAESGKTKVLEAQRAFGTPKIL